MAKSQRLVCQSQLEVKLGGLSLDEDMLLALNVLFEQLVSLPSLFDAVFECLYFRSCMVKER